MRVGLKISFWKKSKYIEQSEVPNCLIKSLSRMYLPATIIQLLILILGSHTFKKHNTKYIINEPKNDFMYKSYNRINENSDFVSDYNTNDELSVPHGITDPIPSHLNFLGDKREAEIRQTLWDEQVPLDKVLDRMDQLQNPEKYNKLFEEYMTTAVTTISSHPSKPTRNDISTADVEIDAKKYMEIGSDIESHCPGDNLESGDYENDGYKSEYEELLSFDFFHLHPSYIEFLEQLMEKKANKAAGIESSDIITTSELDNKIISSQYFNKAAELALDLNCLVENEITSVKWIMEAKNVIEKVLESHNYKLESIKWSCDTIYILLKHKVSKLLFT